MKNFKNLLKSTKVKAKKHSPEILLGLGIAGMIGSTLLAIKSTPKALKLIDEAEKEKGEELTGKEIVKTTWKLYIPTVGLTAASIACLIGGNIVGAKREIALYSALKTSETLATSYKDKVVEKIGTEKEEEIRTEVAEEQLSGKVDKTLNLGNKYRIEDAFTGVVFYASPTEIQKAMNDICYMINRRDFACINDLYDCLGVKPWPKGEDYGWNLHKCISESGALPEVNLNPFLDKNDEVYLELTYTVDPYEQYDVCWM